MSPVDEAWLRMERPENPMMITAVMGLDAAVPHARIEALLHERLASHDRFRERPVKGATPLSPMRWEIDPSFDLRSHVHHVALPAPCDEPALQDLVSDLLSTPLDPKRPLWQVHHVEGLAEGSVIVARVHHAVGDGVALVSLLLSMTDEGSSLAPDDVGVTPPKPSTALGWARVLGEQTLTLGRLLLLPSDPPTPLKGRLGQQKRATWSGPLPVDALKAAAARRGAKLNDLLLASVAGALREYLEARGSTPDRLRAMVPVYVRGQAEQGELGNHFGLVFVPLPIAEADPDARLRAAQEEMRRAKEQPDALVALSVLAAMGIASEEIERVGVDLFTDKASVLVTSVPGPPLPLHLAGTTLRRLMVWAPQSGHIGIGVSLLSYAGELRVGVAADASLVPDPEVIVRSFERLVGAAIEGAT
jgi:hypothetical protein